MITSFPLTSSEAQIDRTPRSKGGTAAYRKGDQQNSRDMAARRRRDVHTYGETCAAFAFALLVFEIRITAVVGVGRARPRGEW